MTDTHATTTGGLMAFWASIDPDYVLRYQQWHNCEHIIERVSIPGFREGRRYRVIGDSPQFLMFYETDGPAVLGSEAYLAALNAPTDWTREALRHFRDPVRNVYTTIAEVGLASAFASPYITALQFDLAPGDEDLYADDWIAAACRIRGVTRVRLFRSNAAIANITTSERAIYGGGPGSQTHLVFIEHDRPPDAVHDPVAAGDEGLARPAPRYHETRGHYWLEMAHRAPAVREGGAA